MSTASSLSAATAAVLGDDAGEKGKAKAEPKTDAKKAPPAADKAAEVKQILTEAKPPIAALLANQWKARESGVFFNTHEVVPNAGTPAEHLTDPRFWANVSQKFKPGDTIIAFPRDAAWYAELVVWDAGQNWANVSHKFGCLERPAFESAPGIEDEFEIRRDPIDGIVVVRRRTGTKMKGNFANHEDARRWILDHQRALRA